MFGECTGPLGEGGEGGVIEVHDFDISQLFMSLKSAQTGSFQIFHTQGQ